MNQNFHDVIKSIVQGTEKEAWLSAGKFLSPYQKRVITDHGWSIIKYIRMLYGDSDPLFKDVVTFSKITGIPVQELFDRLV